MKNFVFFTLFASTFFGCSRHMAVSNTSTEPPSYSETNTSKTAVSAKPLIVVDAHGNILASAKDLPATADKSILKEENAKGYTAEQTKNLAYRYKYVPPKVLFVPDALSKNSNRGVYYVYKTKFWYWKNQNGYYYLDETYYN